ncbi:MAG TPA: hypothetical protein VED24_02625 [Candidatus Acidoferrum sp.]|nr:hypothetical protein [Candidatus Acidoferrum sp.]
MKWQTVIEDKTDELRRFFVRKSTLDLAEPSPKLLGHDNRELRERILTLIQFEATRLEVPKSITCASAHWDPGI